jgi:hypothetical protein
MERFVKGEVVVVPFPFSDLTQAKRRPALVITEWEGEVVYGLVAQLFILVVARFIEPKKRPINQATTLASYSKYEFSNSSL